MDNPEKIKTLICTYPVSEARKELLTNAYDYYVKFRKLTWDKPRFIREDKAFFLPTEEELTILISNAKSIKMSNFLQFLKETACDSGEAWKLKWIDIDSERKTVNITPTKNHNARTLPISDNLLSRFLRLERRNERVFASKDLDSFSRCYALMRNRLSARLENPRIHLTAFRSFRHWKATDLYHRTKDILYVKWFLGHKRLSEMFKALEEEEKRHIKEGLTKEELAVFDILNRPKLKMTKKDEQQVKETAKQLLERLKEQKFVLDWKKKTRTRADVHITIEDILWHHLPEPPYTPKIKEEKSTLVYQHVYDSYQGAGQSIYT